MSAAVMELALTPRAEDPRGRLLRGAPAALEAARQRVDSIEAARRLDPRTAEALVDAGFAAHFVPRAHGGAAGGFADFVSAVALVAEGSASVAWCASVYAAMGVLGSRLPEQGQAELWADGPDTVIACSIAPAGRIEAVPGGWRLSGEWGFASGVAHAAWVFLGGIAPQGEGRAYRIFAVPREQLLIRDTWNNVGLRGTGSNTLVLDGVVVPAHRSFTQASLMAGLPAGPGVARCHSVPYKVVNGLNFVAPALGAAREGLRVWSAYVAGKAELSGSSTRDRGAVRTALAQSAVELDQARLLVEHAARVADEGSADPADAAVRNPLACAAAVDLLGRSVDRLFRLGGARGQTEGAPLQRIWRDVNCAAGHAALQFDAAAEAFAARALTIAAPTGAAHS